MSEQIGPEQHAARAASFDSAAEVYERARPGYPDAAVDWLTASLPAGARVLDLGAGTGKLTRSLVSRGFDVVAVDPSPRMLEQLRAAAPAAETVVGTAERLPLPDGSVDAVVAGQAWHWVDQALALPEVRRVLRPGGVFGPLWNIRRNSVPWMAELDGIIHPSDSDRFVEAVLVDGVIVDPALREGFGPVEHEVVEWSQSMGSDELLALVASRSMFLTSPPEEQERILAEVRALAGRSPELGDPAGFGLPYATHAFRAVRR